MILINKKSQIRPFIISFALIALFVVSMIGFSGQFSSDNNTNISILNNSNVNQTYQNLNLNLSNFAERVDAQENATLETPTVLGQDGIIISTIFGTLKTFLSIPKAIGSGILGLVGVIGGVPVIVLTTILAIIIINWILWTYKAVRQGETG